MKTFNGQADPRPVLARLGDSLLPSRGVARRHERTRLLSRLKKRLTTWRGSVIPHSGSAADAQSAATRALDGISSTDHISREGRDGGRAVNRAIGG
jgi:hypothetical protein